jgi:hypothetical protein
MVYVNLFIHRARFPVLILKPEKAHDIIDGSVISQIVDFKTGTCDDQARTTPKMSPVFQENGFG